MGLIVEVYRSTLIGDCTLGDISFLAQSLCLVNVDGPFAPCDAQPAAMLVPANGTNIAKIVPAEVSAQGKWVPVNGWVSMGGNYAATSDSRFSQAVEKITGGRFYGAVAIHDRLETA